MQIFGCTGAGTPNPCAIQESTASPPLNVNSFRTEQAHIGFNLVTVVPSGDPGAQRSSVLFFEGKNRVNKACLGVSEGEMLGPALAENTGLTELNINWNHLRGPGAVAFARALEVRTPLSPICPLACPVGTVSQVPASYLCSSSEMTLGSFKQSLKNILFGDFNCPSPIS